MFVLPSLRIGTFVHATVSIVGEHKRKMTFDLNTKKIKPVSKKSQRF